MYFTLEVDKKMVTFPAGVNNLSFFDINDQEAEKMGGLSLRLTLFYITLMNKNRTLRDSCRKERWKASLVKSGNCIMLLC